MKEKNYTHYFEFRNILTQFVSAFDSIIINRYNKDKTIEKSIPVRYVYAPKQKILHDLNNKAQHITLPVIAVNLAGISRDSERVQSKNIGHYINEGSNTTRHIPQPVPVDISLNMSIITRYQKDMDQILANFIPYSDPYIILSWKLPEEFTSINTEITAKVQWDETISINQPVDMGEGEKYRNIAETNFVIKGWLFKKHPENPIGNIFEIDTKFHPVSSLSESILDDLEYDEVSLSAYPNISFQKESKFVVGTNPIYKIDGDNFDYTTSVYLSSDNPLIFSDTLSTYDDFNGIPLSSSEYSIVNDNSMYVDIRQINDIGNVSVIIENPSGYTISNPISCINIS